jgi:hypothetical protein
MSRALAFLRDPVWQSVGALVGVVTLFVTIATTSSSGELAVVHMGQVKFSDYGLPKDRVQLLVQGSKQELDRAVVDYYTIANTTSRPILPADYAVALEVTRPEGGPHIFLVESCSKFLAEGPGGNRTSSGGAYVPFEWATRGNDRWTATPALMNQDDQSCVMVISEVAGGSAPIGSKPVEWNARITNVRFGVYTSVADFNSKASRPWYEYFATAVVLLGAAVYWFVLLQTVLFLSMAALLTQAGWPMRLSFKYLTGLLVTVLLSTSTAEILIDIFINRRSNLSPLVWPLLALHGFFALYLVYASLRRKAGRRARSQKRPQP